jgi:curved DNA-binding protein CbpA
MPFPDYYEILGLTEGISFPGDLKPAYKAAALKLHPDKNPNDPRATANFQLLRTAVEVFQDPSKRRAYQSSYRKYMVLKIELQSLHDKRKDLREERSELNSNWIRVNAFDFPRWGRWEDYVGFGGGDEEIRDAICKVLSVELEENKKELEDTCVKIEYLEENIDKLPV